MAHGIAPHGYTEIVKYYGDPAPVLGKASLRWEGANMILVRDLPGIAKLYVHRKIHEPLRAALTEAAALNWYPKTIGCFNVRQKRSGSGLSVHAFGAAVDLDATDNAMVLRCPVGDPRRAAWAVSENRIPEAIIDIFRAQGWTWGGDFVGSFDPMHFQFCSGY